MPRGMYYVDAFFPGFPTAWRKTVELDESELILEIPERGSLRLAVELPEGATFEQASAFVRMRAPVANWVHAAMRPDPRHQAFFMELLPGGYRVVVQLEGCAAEYLEAEIEAGKEACLVVAPKRGVSARIQIVMPRPLGTGEVLRLVVEEADRAIQVPFLREEPGEACIRWVAVDLTVDARRLHAYTEGANTAEGLNGELLLGGEHLRPGAVLRVELVKPDPSARIR